ncbi:MAG TPA: Na-translocating system protein MpsC family protein [Solirubrobacteraceae bacterium]|nr:Na-translocating system protein MpsC family protein [Solirubrobacteraceae bacterium]
MAEISNAVVRIHKHAYGKGPVKARAHLTRDLLTVVLEGGFTRAEQTLHRHGHSQQVVDSRITIERAIENELRAAVETILYRAVRSLMSAVDPANDLQVEVFLLESCGSEELPGADGAIAPLTRA